MSGLEDAERKQLERRIYNRQENLERPAYGDYWDPELYRRMFGYELEPDVDRLGRRYLTGKEILVLGAGVSDVTNALRYSDQVTAINISEREIERLRGTFPRVEARVEDAEELGADRRYQAIYCHSILHHLHPFEEIVERLHAALRPAGVLFVASEPGLLNPLAAAARAWTPSREHTPGERPFIFSSYHAILKRHFEIVAARRYLLTSMLWPYLARRLPRSRGLWRGLLAANMRLERGLRAARLFDAFFWIVAGVYRRRERPGTD